MDAKTTEQTRQLPRHSIAVVARRTGLSQLVLRAWERRYGAVVPARTSTGRRRYTDDDVEKLVLLARLTAGEHRIGDIATLSLDDLRDLAQEFQVATTATTPPTDQATAADDLLAEALTRVAHLDAKGLRTVLDRSLVDLSKPSLRNKLLVPLLEEIGDRWRHGQLRVAHEHMASSIVSAFLGALNARYRVAAGSPVLAVATPVGHQHELGALLAASVAYEAGWDVLYLGPDLPVEDLVAAVKGRGAGGLLLSLVFPHGDPATGDALRKLRDLVGPRLPLIVGGQAAGSYAEVLHEIDARIVHDLDELEQVLSF